MHSISKLNLPFSRTKLNILLFICVEISLYLKNYALLSRYHAIAIFSPSFKIYH